MATLNSFIRATSAAARRAERSHQRRAREAARQHKARRKEDEMSNTTQAIQQYNDYISILKSVHKDVADPVDWQALLKEEAPGEPTMTNDHENDAILKLKNYKPSFVDKLFWSATKKIAKLENDLQLAKQKDISDFEKRRQEYISARAEWEMVKKMSKGVLEKDIHSFKDALEYFNPYMEIGELGSRLTFEIKLNYITVDLQINNDEVIPNYILSQTSTGKLSKKNMPVSKFNELYQDYVCSCALRVARETLAFLPVNFVLVNALGYITDTSTGKTGEQAILSVVIFPEVLNTLNFETIDPSDSMKNFHHNMRFSKTTGFNIIEKINGDTLIN